MNSTFKPTEIKELEQETYRLSLQDGVMEMFMGIMLLVTSNLYNNTLPMGVILVFLLFVFPYMSRMMKNRFTYPRTGYIKVRTTNEFQKNDLIAFVIFLTMVISLSGILILLFPNGYGDSENLYRVMPFAFGMVLFGPAMHLADKTGQDRYLMIGVLPTITGMLVSVLSVLNDPWIIEHTEH